MNGRKIPNPVIAVVADVIGSHYYNHTKINTLFQESGAPGEPPEANCVQKCEQGLKRCNTHPHVDAHQVLGRILENFMEVPINPHGFQSEEHEARKKRVRDILSKHSLSYHEGGIILGAGSGPASRSLHELIRAKDLPGVEQEFQRALATVEADPPSGVTAASSLLESLLKMYLDDYGVPFPGKEKPLASFIRLFETTSAWSPHRSLMTISSVSYPALYHSLMASEHFERILALHTAMAAGGIGWSRGMHGLPSTAHIQ